MQRDFQGEHFHVLLKEFSADVTSTHASGIKVWSGLFYQILLAASRVLNFTFQAVDGSGLQWGMGQGEDADVGFYGTIIRGVCVYGLEVDVGLTTTDYTYGRQQWMDFVDPIHYSPIVMIYRRPPSHTVSIFLRPLSPALLMALGAALPALLVALMALEGLAMRRETGNRLSVWSCLNTLDRVARIVGGALLLEASMERLSSRAGRVVLWSWWMVTVVVAAAYTGTLTAFLSVNSQTPLFSRPRHLLTRQHRYTWGTLGSSGMSIMFQENNSTLYQALLAAMRTSAVKDPSVLSPDLDTLWAKVLSEDFVLFIPSVMVPAVLRADCSLQVTDTRMRVSMSSFVLPQGSTLTRPLSDVILRLQRSGLLQQWIDHWYPRASCPPTSAQPVVISLLHVQGMLLPLALGLGLALIVLGLEGFYSLWRKSERNSPVFLTQR